MDHCAHCGESFPTKFNVCRHARCRAAELSWLTRWVVEHPKGPFPPGRHQHALAYAEGKVREALRGPAVPRAVVSLRSGVRSKLLHALLTLTPLRDDVLIHRGWVARTGVYSLRGCPLPAHKDLPAASVTFSDPWRGASPYDASGGLVLPEAEVLSLSIAPLPPKRIGIAETYALHGMLTGLTDGAHDVVLPHWRLFPHPEGSGWAVVLFHGRHVRAIAGRHEATLFGRPVVLDARAPAIDPFKMRHPSKLRLPSAVPAGRYVIAIATCSPVTIKVGGDRQGGLGVSEEGLRATLAYSLPARVVSPFFPQGAPFSGDDDSAEANLVRAMTRVSQEKVPLRVLHTDVHPARVACGPKFGVVFGWEGRVIVETNATGAWLLEAAAMVGLGGRTALGFGHIAVTYPTVAELAQPLTGSMLTPTVRAPANGTGGAAPADAPLTYWPGRTSFAPWRMAPTTDGIAELRGAVRVGGTAVDEVWRTPSGRMVHKPLEVGHDY